MKRRILFVDDEPLVLQALQRQLRPMRAEWEMEFAEGGAAALQRLKEAPCDVIVSDMMMPGLNGAELLKAVRAESPKTIRIVLSGHAEQQLALDCLGVAHQFVAKPCDAESLRSTIARATDLGFAVQSEPLLDIVGRLEQLPSLRAVAMRLLRLLNDQGANITEIGALMESDIALSAHVLKIVNSAFFGLAQRVTKPADAVAYLGFDTLKAIVLSVGLLGQLSVDDESGYSAEIGADHAQKVGAAARAIAKCEGASRSLADECFIAGLLHDVGKLILACNLPTLYATALAAEQQGLPAAELGVFGTTHADIGAYLLGLWGLPQSVVEAIRLHHSPSASTVKGFTALTAVHMADQLVPRSTAISDKPSYSLDEAYLASIGLTDRIPVWRSSVEELFWDPTLCLS